MPSMTEVKCANKRCGATFKARTADVARGWGKFCSKSCKAAHQEARTGQHRDFQHRQREYDRFGPTFSNAHLFSNEEHDCNKGND